MHPNLPWSCLIFAALLLLGSCRVTHRPSCDAEEREVSDDESLGSLSFTVRELVATTEREFSVDLRDTFGATHTSVVSAARRAGPAMLADATATTTETTHPGFGKEILLVGMICEDRVNVPMSLSIVSDDGAIFVDGDTVAGNEFASTSRIVIEHDLDPATDVLPPPLGAQTDGHVKVLYEGGELVSMWGWWGADSNHEESVQWP